MKKFIESIKGFLIGLGSITPGLSGGTIAILTGLYDRIIYNIGHFFERPWKAIKDILFIAIGMIVGIIFAFFVITEFLFPYLPLEMCLLFSGLIVGGIPSIYKKTTTKKWNYKSYIFGLLTLALLVFVSVMEVTNFTGAGKTLTFDLKNMIIAFLLGIVAAITLVVPGISGSVILLALGYYFPLVNVIKLAVNEAITFNFGGNVLLLCSLGLGVIFGMVFSSILIDYLLRKYYHFSYMAILGLILGSAIGVVMIGIKEIIYFDLSNGLLVLHIFASVLLFAAGVYFGGKLEKLGGDIVDFNDLAKKNYDSALEDLKEILKYKSVLNEYNPNSSAPFGVENKKCLEHMLSIGERDGFTVKNVDNYAGHIALGDAEEIVGILGHLDVVPAVGKWSNDPFTPTIKNDKLYARGTLDDKGGVIASYYAMKIIKDLNLPIKKQIRLIVGCDEESGSRCLEHYFETEQKPACAISPDAEFPLIFGEKGILSFDLLGDLGNDDVLSFESGLRYNIVPDLAKLVVKNPNEQEIIEFNQEFNQNAKFSDGAYYFYGESSHAMQPECGINAAYIMFLFMNKYYPSALSEYIVNYYDTTGKKQNIDLYDDEMKALTINLGIARCVNGQVKLGYNLRVPVDSHVDVIKNGFESKIKKFGFIFTNMSYSPRHYVNPQSDFVKTLMEAYQTISNDYKSEPMTIGGGTYARILKNAVAFGPNFPFREDICHQPDEFIYLEDFTKWIAIYAKAIYDLAK